MTAHDLISDIFSRVQTDVPGNVRFISPPQYKLLLDLIGQDEEGGRLRNRGAWFEWSPSGRWRYEIRGDMHTKTRTLTRAASFQPSSAGTLFT